MRWLLLFAVAVIAGSCSERAAPAPEDDNARYELFVLGIAQDGGVPHLGCERACCVEARATGQQRHPVSLGIHDRTTGKLLLVEATPAIEPQVALLHDLAGVSGRGRKPVDAILLTHTHIGHYLGLAWLGREVAGSRGVALWGSTRMASFLRGHGPWKQLVELGQIELHEVRVGARFEPMPGLTVEAIPVPHRDEFTDTVAFRIHGPGRTVLFVPDVDRWERTGDLLGQLLDGVDVAYLDASFYDGNDLPGRDMSEIPHPPMVDTMERLAERARAAPGALRFIHFNHTNPALRDPALRAEIVRRGFGLAERGERVTL